jgi:hypothetical protein
LVFTGGFDMWQQCSHTRKSAVKDFRRPGPEGQLLERCVEVASPAPYA